MKQTVLGEVREEFEGAEIPDWRLRDRLMQLATALDENPVASIPKASKTSAACEAAYRFLGNSKVESHGILAPHIDATAGRCRAEQTVYVASDTSEFSFGGPQRGKQLGRLQGHSRGFLGHFALAISGSGVPLGVAGLEVIIREERKKPQHNGHARKKDPTRESLRWAAMVESTSAALEGSDPIHLMDSEADIFELLTAMQAQGRRFIIRSGQDRLVEQGHLAEVVQQGTVVLSREVRLSRRTKVLKPGSTGSKRNPPREGRLAELTVSAMKVSLKRPKTCSSDYPALLPVNVVRVYEPAAPEEQEPVEWILLTSESIDSPMDVAAVVDGYRRRWLIEEFFKAIKTGCAYESRELESTRTLSNLLAIVAVIAWRLLLLRSLERQNSQLPATEIVPPQLLAALAARLRENREPKPLPTNPTVADLMTGIARLGGHITNNGPPGWQVLWRGYQDLLTWGGGFIRGRSITYRDQS
jgi:hypothetical protein